METVIDIIRFSNRGITITILFYYRIIADQICNITYKTFLPLSPFCLVVLNNFVLCNNGFLISVVILIQHLPAL